MTMTMVTLGYSPLILGKLPAVADNFAEGIPLPRECFCLGYPVAGRIPAQYSMYRAVGILGPYQGLRIMVQIVVELARSRVKLPATASTAYYPSMRSQAGTKHPYSVRDVTEPQKKHRGYGLPMFSSSLRNDLCAETSRPSGIEAKDTRRAMGPSQCYVSQEGLR